MKRATVALCSVFSSVRLYNIYNGLYFTKKKVVTTMRLYLDIVSQAGSVSVPPQQPHTIIATSLITILLKSSRFTWTLRITWLHNPFTHMPPPLTWSLLHLVPILVSCLVSPAQQLTTSYTPLQSPTCLQLCICLWEYKDVWNGNYSQNQLCL